MNNPIPANNYRANKYFLIAFGLLNIMAFTLLLCGLSLLAGLTISKWQFPMACLLGLITNYYASVFFMGEKAKAFFLKSSSAILISIIAAIFLAGLFYDVSYDGQWYHQETLYRLKQGYNPAYQNLEVPKEEIFITENTPVNLKYLAINYFSKGSEYLEAPIYQLTNRIETAKAVNCILLLASFLLCLTFFYKINSISITKKWLLAALFAFNPVSVMQLLSFCADGNLGCLLLCLLAICGLLFIEVKKQYLFLLGSIIVMVVNIKFTGLVFAAIYCIGFLTIILIYKKENIFKKVLITGIFSALIGIICCGFNPYITNLIKKHDLFYGLDDIHTQTQSLTAPVLRDLNRFEKLFFSLSAHEGRYSADKSSVWQIPKIPFTFNKEDILDARDEEQFISGFGPFFSGALLTAIAFFVIALIRFRKSPVFKLTAAVLLVFIATVIITPYAWWARYIPQLWLIPVIILCMVEFIPMRGIRFFKGVLYISLGLNIAWASLNIVFHILTTSVINYQLQQLKAINKPITVEYGPADAFTSNRVRFAEAGIHIIEGKVTGPYVYTLLRSNTRYATPVPLPILPKPFLVKLGDKIKGEK